MILWWMLWATAITAVLGMAAHLVEGALEGGGRATRWTWAGALGASLTLQAWSLLRAGASPVAAGVPLPRPGASRLGQEPGGFLDAAATLASNLPVLPDAYAFTALLGWALAAFVLTTGLVGGLLALRSRAATWHPGRVEGDDVLVSEDFGPAVVGVWSPRIVLPRWALEMSRLDLRLAYLHEAEHRAARDPSLLLLGALSVSLTPWNVALWWLVRRLRAAVEIDCDRRVLHSGASRRAYGALLLDIGCDPLHSRLPALALARPASLLERRLKMIVKNEKPKGPVRTALAGGLAVGLAFAACQAPAPTENEVADEPAAPIVRLQRTPDSVWSTPSMNGNGDVRPILLLDGVEIASEAVASLDTDLIERIEIVKGAAATTLYGPEASAGVVQIFTKPSAERAETLERR